MAKRTKSADTEPDKSSHEEERALAQLLALLDGRGEFDGQKIVARRKNRVNRHR